MYVRVVGTGVILEFWKLVVIPQNTVATVQSQTFLICAHLTYPGDLPEMIWVTLFTKCAEMMPNQLPPRFFMFMGKVDGKRSPPLTWCGLTWFLNYFTHRD